MDIGLVAGHTDIGLESGHTDIYIDLKYDHTDIGSDSKGPF